MCAVENPKSAAAVRNVLNAVKRGVPKRFVSRSDMRLESMVPPEIIIEITPMYDMGSPNSRCIIGHPEPKSESGSPSPIKAK